MPKVLVTDEIAPEGLEILQQSLDVDLRLGIPEDDLVGIIGDYEGLVVRSQTKVNRRIIEHADGLKVIGRAGVGVDNIDLDAATEKGIIVVNSPAGNTLAVAEYSLGMLLALLRKIPHSHASLKSGKWSRSQYMGQQLFGKKLGIIGIGRIGTEVARRAKALGMEVLGSDPFLSSQRAHSLGIELCEVADIFARPDFITFHCPLTKETRNLVNPRSLAQMKDGVFLVNCARGGVIDEAALYDALRSGKVAGAALDVYQEEPPKGSPLLELDNVVATPHLAASTIEAQVDVAVDVADQIVDVFAGRSPANAVNIPSLSPELLESLRPYINLAEKIGLMQGQLADGRMESVELTYGGSIAEHETAVITRCFLKGLIEPMMPRSVNMVNSPHLAESRGIQVVEKRTVSAGDYASMITTALKTSAGTHEVSGTVFGRHDPRIICIDNYRVDIVPQGYVMLSGHVDRPGVIGRVGTLLGNAGINIAAMQVGREHIGGNAVMVLNVDAPISEELLEHLSTLENIHDARMVDFTGSSSR
ncbi:MAG: phosphoglycerate dehydrogenase [Armatimonadetes bacterium]|nr:phosphoglycerate dehydrogenase [Armatimonadota bacterium]